MFFHSLVAPKFSKIERVMIVQTHVEDVENTGFF